MVKFSKGLLLVEKRTLPQWMLFFIFAFPFCQAFIVELIRIPDAVRFLMDVAVVILLTTILLSRNVSVSKSLFPGVVIILSFLAYSLFVYALRYQSIFYYLWGMRNLFRFYTAFLAFALLLEKDDADRWMKSLDWIYIIHIVAAIIQYMMGFKQDYLGGIFGVQKGCNGSLIVFMAIVIFKTVIEFLEYKKSVFKCFSFVILSLVIATFAELKIYFIVFIAILIMALIMTKRSLRKIALVTFSVIGIIIFSTVLSLLYDEFADFLSIENLWLAFINPNYATKEDVGRFTAIPVISEKFLPSVFDKLVGLGLGNCDISSIEIFNSVFSKYHSDIHFYYFQYGFLYLETGIIGLILYVAFFVFTFISTRRFYKKGIVDSMTCRITMATSILCIVLTFYNSSLRGEITYFAYFVLALPFVYARGKNSE